MREDLNGLSTTFFGQALVQGSEVCSNFHFAEVRMLRRLVSDLLDWTLVIAMFGVNIGVATLGAPTFLGG